MKKYRVIYSKGSFPMSAWYESKEQACEKASALLKAGYDANVWEYTKDFAREIGF